MLDVNNIKQYISDTDTCKLNDEEKNICEDLINESEVYEAVKQLKHGKSPGLDGIIPEFYQSFWEVLRVPFMEMLNETFEKGEMSASMRQSVISLIFKKGDKDKIKNYRPISLTNYDYKIVAFVLARRLQSVINKLIHTDQSGYIKGRFIGNNARLINDIMEYCEKYDISGAIICLDFEKAFDLLEWNFMIETLKQYNLGDNFISWIKILYKNASFVVKNNGWLSESTKMERGVRQGCPISAMLFILAIEIMSIHIRTHNEIVGFTFDDIVHKLSQYADDTTLLLANVDSIKVCLNVINRFCDVSGLKINLSKTEGIWVGPFKQNPNIFEGIHFTCKAIRCLGIYIGHDKEECYTGNWLNKISKLKNSLHVWKSRKLTIYGKIAILKSLGLSKLIYSFSVLHVPSEIKKEVNSIIYKFVWRNVERIKRSTLINEYENGGMKMIDIESMINALKAAWIPRLMQSKHVSSFLCHQLKKCNVTIKMLIEGNVTVESQLEKALNLNTFYLDCITSFNRCKSFPVNEIYNVHEFLSQPLWCNRLFMYKGCVLLYKHWIASGICWVKDLYDEKGNLLTSVDIRAKLIDKRNWMSEVILIRKLVGKVGKRLDCLDIAKYVNINTNKTTFVINNKRYCIHNQKCKFFYHALVLKKRTRPHVEKSWQRELSINYNQYDWCLVYSNRIHGIPIKKLSEFMYKLIQKLLVSREILKKWNRVNSELCPVCHEIENVQHIYYDCDRIRSMWSKLGIAINIELSWKKIVFGYTQNIVSHNVRNLLFSIILYSIFKKWMSGLEDEINYMHTNMIHYIKQDVHAQSFYFRYSKVLSKDKMFNKLWDITINNVMKM